MRLLFLGTGTSQGVPIIGCQCDVCSSTDPKDKRFRSSLLIQNDCQILIDTGPDLRMQALAYGLAHIDAVLYTHCHNDHVMGFDDLRRFCEISGRPMPVYASQPTLEALQRVFPYAFDPEINVSSYIKAELHCVDANRAFNIGGTTLEAFNVPHGYTPTFGYLISVNGQRKAAYLPDCAALTPEMTAVLADIPILIIDGLRDQPHPTHLNIAGAIEVGRQLRAQKIYLTHITHLIKHAERQPLLPDNVFLTYDGFTLDL